MHNSGLHGTIDGASGITQGTKSQNGTDIYYGTETLVKHKRKNRPAGDKNGEHIGHYQLIKVLRFRLDKRFGYETTCNIDKNIHTSFFPDTGFKYLFRLVQITKISLHNLIPDTVLNVRITLYPFSHSFPIPTYQNKIAAGI